MTRYCRKAGETPTDFEAARWALLVIFAFSGASGLVYEVVWVRELTLVLGASTYAVTIILAAFMSGLGIGSWFFGRLADRMHEASLAKCYVLLEAGIGLFALVLPVLMALQQHVYVSFHHYAAPPEIVSNAVRLLLAFFLFIVPTSLMGATLPVISRYVIRSQTRISVTVSRFYAANTLGAVLGTVLAGYILLPRYGNAFTNLSAVSVNFLVAAAFWSIHRHIAGRPVSSAHAGVINHPLTEEKASPMQRAAVWAFALSGVSAMFYEVAWTRTLTMILGTTTFAFTTMLATFLLGIALGSAFYGIIRRFSSPSGLFVCLQSLVALSALLSVPLFSWLPFLYLTLYGKMGGDWGGIQVIRFLLASSVMLVPTAAMGCIFPVVSDILVSKTDVLGRRLGKAYGLNTFGAVVGASVSGLILIPAVGMQKTILLGAFLNLGAAICVAACHTEVPSKRRFAVVACVALLLTSTTLLLKPWSPKIMSSGVYAYASRYHELIDRIDAAGKQTPQSLPTNPWRIWQMAMEQYSLLYYKAGPACTVSVMERNDGVRFLTVDGKTDASTGTDHDMKTQTLLGQLPLLYHPAPDEIFVVGLGSGVTVGSVLTHNVRLVDCAEFSNSVINAAQFFSEVNHNALEDPRLRIIPRDARNFLLTSQNDYDVIISQPSNPWISGQSSLFSLEWYRIVHSRLKEGGMFAQWVPAYCMAEQDVKIIIHTLRSVFPHITAWTSGAAGELILLATKDQALNIPYEQFQNAVSPPVIANDIRRLGYDPPLLPFLTFAMSEQDIAVYLYSDLTRPLRQNTDDFLITEFSTPKQLAQQHNVTRFATTNALRGEMSSLLGIMPDVDMDAIVQRIKKDISAS